MLIKRVDCYAVKLVVTNDTHVFIFVEKTASARKDSGQSYLVGFLVALFVVFLFVGVVVFIYFKRDKFKQIYLEWKIKRDARKAE